MRDRNSLLAMIAEGVVETDSEHFVLSSLGRLMLRAFPDPGPVGARVWIEIEASDW